MQDDERKIDSYKTLKVYQKTICVFDITCYFVERFLDRGHDRTVDQMQQAARSGKQNIVEGYSDAEGSTDSEHKLTVIAKGSLEELKEDYLDYLRTHQLSIWQQTDFKYQQCIPRFRRHNDTEYYMKQIEGRSAEDIANIALIVIYQTLAMLHGYIKFINRKFLEQGGIKEQRYWKRVQYRESRFGRDGRFGREQEPNTPTEPTTPTKPLKQ